MVSADKASPPSEALNAKARLDSNGLDGSDKKVLKEGNVTGEK
jgi:hypothetical protein